MGSGLGRLWSSAVLALILLLLATSTAVAIAGSWGGWYWAPGSVLDVLVGAAALLRRGRLLGMAAAAVVASCAALAAAWVFGLPAAPGPAAAVGLSVLVGAVVRRRRGSVAAGTAVGGLIVVVATYAAAWPHLGPTGVTVVNAGGWVGGVLVGLLLRLLDVRRRTAFEVVRLDERARLAVELHDVAAHHLAGVILQAQAAQLLLHRATSVGSEQRLADLEESLVAIDRAGSEGLDAIRRVVGLLRTSGGMAAVVTAPEDVSALVDRFNQRHPDRPARLRSSGTDRACPPEVATTIHRIVQEALTNVSLHAPRAQSVHIDIVQTETAVTVAVVDDGPGNTSTDGRAENGYGLLGMRERAEALGGSLDISGGRSGWSVRAALPIRGRVDQ